MGGGEQLALVLTRQSTRTAVQMRGVERPLRGTATIDDPTVFIDFVEVDTEGTIIMQQHGQGGNGAAAAARQGGGSGAALWGAGGEGDAAGRRQQLLGSPVVRLAFVAAATALVLTVLAGGVGGGGAGGALDGSGVVLPGALPLVRRDQLWQLVVALLGFMTVRRSAANACMSPCAAPPRGRSPRVIIILPWSCLVLLLLAVQGGAGERVAVGAPAARPGQGARQDHVGRRPAPRVARASAARAAFVGREGMGAAGVAVGWAATACCRRALVVGWPSCARGARLPPPLAPPWPSCCWEMSAVSFTDPCCFCKSFSP